ncbi:uncharacterized protein LOC105845782 isoform X2 [Hydra vulgaris]|uniref:uncharacterized protein LOC105845782 isoform X2 n=1 Tax=Hydra vulgaris TaxID=6087 RepID=UPI001F5EC1CF|nr:uncharacterized protein LOC105845782 isoform X1 [Hydra vulgaris]XP_047139727.1 uncharacterized protein LOC105845782 isoform X1 [Hydra vulgaris]
MSSISSFICSFCQVEKFILNKYLTHLQICHEAEANFTVACGLNGCPCAYNTIKGLRQHMRIKHNQIYYADRNKTNVDESLHSSVNEGLELLNCDFDNELASSTLNQPLNRDINDFVFKLQKHFAMFVIGLGQKHSIPTIVQLEIGNEVHALINYFSSNYGDCLKNYLSKAGFILDSHHDLVELFKSEALLDKAFSVVSSEAKIMTYCKANLGFVAPLQIEIQADYDKQIINDIKNDKRNSLTNIAQIIAKISSQVKTNTSQTINSTRYLNNQKKFFQYIPILEVIKKFVQHKDVWASIHRANQNKNQSSDLLCSYRDGNIFHKHVVFCKNKHALRIHMYIDEFEVCNPIGSHRSTHKLCAFYFFIGNLEYKYHSQLKYIHLCLLIKEKYIKQSNTYAELLKPLISDLNELCLNGIALTIDGESLQLYGALATISADNLSAHALAGFRCAFNSGHICRYCMLRYEDKEKLLQETVLALRTETLHKYHLQGINAGISGRVYGVVKRCPLLDLSYFKLTESFPPDLMHDLHEGIIPLILKLLIINLHCDGIVTVSQLNYEIENFEFLKNDKKNKPIVIPLTVPSGTGNIVGSASEKFSLFYFLTFLIGDRVPINNKHWKLYLLLRDIVDYLMCYKISRTVLSYLQLLVESFVQTFVELYPGKLTPKLHFLLHYPRLIADYGPLRYLWCMRFEAKHQYFKKLAGAVRNFKNIAYILAKRHQLHQCWEFEASSFLKEITESSGECSIYFNNIPECHRSKIICFFEVSNFSDSEVLWKCNKLTIDSVKYKIYDVVLVGSLHGEDIPLFFKIMYIYKLKESWFFIGKVLICEQFSVHLHAYSVKEDIELSVCQPCNIIDPQLLNSYILADGKIC